MTIIFHKKKYLLSLFFTLIVFTYLLPSYFTDLLKKVPIANNVLLGLSLVLMASLLFFGRFRWNRTDCVLIVIYACYLFSSALNHQLAKATVLHVVEVILLCFTFQCVLKDETETQVLLRVIRAMCIALFIANLIVAVVYPEGIPSITESGEDPRLLYGNMNSTVRYLFPGLICSVLLDAKQGKRLSLITAVFFIGYVFLCIRVYFMATGLCAMLFLICWSLGKSFISKRIRLIALFILALMLLFELLVVVFDNQTIADVICAIFGKAKGFTGRTYHWANCVKYIKERPVFGYGNLSSPKLNTMLWSPSGAHNYFLDMLFQRGIVGAIPVFFFLLCPFFRKAPEKRRMEHYILTGFALAYIVMFLFEPFYHVEKFHFPLFYVLNTLPDYAPQSHTGEAEDPLAETGPSAAGSGT